MKHSEIKARIQALSNNPSVSEVRTLRTDVEEAWKSYMLNKLSIAFRDDADESQCLSNAEALLRDVWLLIQGTSVSYTARPDSALTHVLLDIASWIAEAHNQAWRTSIQDELATHQEAWFELESNYLNTKADCIKHVQGFLKEQWTFDASMPRFWASNPPLNMTILAWSKQIEQQINMVPGPDDVWRTKVIKQLHELTRDTLATEKQYQFARPELDGILQSHWGADSGKVMPDAYDASNPNISLRARLETIHESLQIEGNYNVLSILMPGVYQGDTGDLSATDILKNHILSESGKYLYPVSLIADVRLIDELEAQPNNPNYDDTRGHADQQINPEEWQRLITHSPHTEAVMQAKANYQALSTQNHHLLGQLTTLIHQLALNDAHGGRGTQEDAAGQVYSALLQFKNYYETLPQEKISEIPGKIREEINLLLNVAFNPESSVRTENPIQTCIGSRREALYAAILGHDALLAGISMGDDARQRLIEELKEVFNKAHDELKHALDNDTYTGRDNLGVTPALLENLGITVKIESLADINFIVQGMEGQDLADILSQDDVRSQMIQQFTKLEALVILAMETSSTKLPTVFHALEARVHELAQTPEDLAALLISLQVDKIEIMLQIMSDKFSDTIEYGSQFGAVLRHLAVEQRTVVYEAMKEKLPDIIQSGWGLDLGFALKYCTVEQCTEVIDIIKNDLSDVFENGDEFQVALSQLTPEQRTVVYEGMKDKFSDIIHDSREFGSVLRCLTPEQCTAVTLTMPGIIKSVDDYHVVVKNFDPEQVLAFSNILISQASAASWDEMIEFLEGEGIKRTDIHNTALDIGGQKQNQMRDDLATMRREVGQNEAKEERNDETRFCRKKS